MDLCLPTVCSGSTKDAVQGNGASFCSLSFDSLAHDRAAAGEDLKIGHGSSTGGDMASSGRGEGTKSGGRGLIEEGTHGTGLPEKSLHCEGSKVED